MKGCIFNIDAGYLEGLCRGFKCGILKQSDYLNLVQCETLEGICIRIVFILLHTNYNDNGIIHLNIYLISIDNRRKSYVVIESHICFQI